jgi:RHS repeat-associated protein
VTKRDGLTQTWASFDLPTTLQATAGGTTYQSTFAYGPDHQRWRQIATYANGTETTHYVGGLLEKVHATSTGKTYWRHYVNTPTGLTAVISRNSDNSEWTTFALSDHLGSSDALLDTDGALLTRLSFDAFGARRGSDWTTTTPPDWGVIADTTRRGFTFHEMLDNIGLVHMNGRVYDPIIGRFMSVDPVVGSLADSQSVNPYAYVGNRPLTYIDPSGFNADDPDGGPDQPQCGIECNPDGPVASWDWWDDLFDSVGDALDGVDDFFEDLFGLNDPPPPPPATTLPGTSGQNGVNVCDGGLSAGPCAGSTLGADERVDFSVVVPDYYGLGKTELSSAVVDIIRQSQLLKRNEDRVRRLENAEEDLQGALEDLGATDDEISQVLEEIRIVQEALEEIRIADPEVDDRLFEEETCIGCTPRAPEPDLLLDIERIDPARIRRDRLGAKYECQERERC